MAKQRKPNNTKARIDNVMRSLLRNHHACIVDAELPEIQVMLNWKNGQQIITRPVADALCDIAHRWTIYISVLCQQPGKRYTKTEELKPQGIYRVADVSDVIEQHHAELLAACNPQHVMGSAWIAIPNDVSLTEEQINFIYNRVGAWRRNEVLCG